MPVPESVLSVLPDRVRGWLADLAQRSPQTTDTLEEIRLRVGQPVQLVGAGGEGFLRETGQLTSDPRSAPPVTAAEVGETVRRASRHSVYAYEEEIRQGFLTLPGGHRMGIAGRCVMVAGQLKTIDPVSGLSLRLHRQFTGLAEPLLPKILSPTPPYVHSTLIISPPGGGKTSLLRDLARLLSDGGPLPGGPSFPARKVVIVDERSELAGCWQGIPQLSVGCRTDVLDRCPKAEGIIMSLRGMSPDVIVTDEIGRPEDLLALQEAENAGVAVLASAHGASWEEVVERPALRPLREAPFFRRVVVLSRRRGPGTVEKVFHPARPAGTV
ncbi:MAG: stage III sporulation protein AA [Limnochordales bacterium]|nr:stage III sporulation protein AA [Limnochordales bacterium]